MRISYAPDMVPLAAMAGGPNEESDGFADGLVATSPNETHKTDLSLPEGYVSRADKWRHLAQNRVAQVAAILALSVPAAGALTACAGQERRPGVSASAAPNAQGNHEVAGDPSCYVQFDKLGIAAQEDCRALIGSMDMTDVAKLKGLDQARWASYYRHSILGEQGILHNLVRSGIIDHNGAPDVAQTFLVDYQASIYTMSWLLQNKPEIGQDPRTALALLGTTDKNSDAYKMVSVIAQNRPSYGADMNTYAIAPANTPVFASFTPESPGATRRPDGTYTLSFDTDMATPDGATKKQHFAFTLYPHLDIQHDDSGKGKEAKDDPSDPIKKALGTPLLAGTPVINASAA